MDLLKTTVHCLVSAAKARLTEMIGKEAMVLLGDDSLALIEIMDVENAKNWVLASTAIMHRAVCWSFGSIPKAHTLKKYLH